MRYYDPRYDITFKKVFTHPELLISFLNALLPLKADNMPIDLIAKYTNLSPEQIEKL